MTRLFSRNGIVVLVILVLGVTVLLIAVLNRYNANINVSALSLDQVTVADISSTSGVLVKLDGSTTLDQISDALSQKAGGQVLQIDQIDEHTVRVFVPKVASSSSASASSVTTSTLSSSSSTSSVASTSSTSSSTAVEDTLTYKVTDHTALRIGDGLSVNSVMLAYAGTYDWKTVSIVEKTTTGIFADLRSFVLVNNWDISRKVAMKVTDSNTVFIVSGINLVKSSSLQSDVNWDGEMSESDLLFFAKYFANTTPNIVTALDQNSDGNLNIVDYSLILAKVEELKKTNLTVNVETALPVSEASRIQDVYISPIDKNEWYFVEIKRTDADNLYIDLRTTILETGAINTNGIYKLRLRDKVITAVTQPQYINNVYLFKPEVAKEDVNWDGKINQSDLDYLSKYLNTSVSTIVNGLDQNGDGLLDISDLRLVGKMVG